MGDRIVIGPVEHPGSRRRLVRHIIMLLALVAGASACGGSGPTPETSTLPTVQGGSDAGPEVTVTGRITRIIEGRTFELGRSGAEPLLVLSMSGYRSEVGTLVTATGRVRTLRVETLEDELRMDLDQTRLRPLEGTRILVAPAVEPSEP